MLFPLWTASSSQRIALGYRVDCDLIFSFPIEPGCYSLLYADPNRLRREPRMIANVGRDMLDEAFRRVRDLDLSLQEQLRALAETLSRERPEFAAAVDRLVTRLRHYGAGEAAPKIGDSMPPFVLPDESAQTVSLEELLDRGPVASRALLPLLPDQHQYLGGGAQGIACQRRDRRYHARSA